MNLLMKIENIINLWLVLYTQKLDQQTDRDSKYNVNGLKFKKHCYLWSNITTIDKQIYTKNVVFCN